VHCEKDQIKPIINYGAFPHPETFERFLLYHVFSRQGRTARLPIALLLPLLLDWVLERFSGQSFTHKVRGGKTPKGQSENLQLQTTTPTPEALRKPTSNTSWPNHTEIGAWGELPTRPAIAVDHHTERNRVIFRPCLADFGAPNGSDIGSEQPLNLTRACYLIPITKLSEGFLFTPQPISGRVSSQGEVK